MNVAFIGLGNMGSNIAQCILKAGFDLTVWNRTVSKMQPLVEQGAKQAVSAKEATSGADVVVTCLMDDQSILDNLQAGKWNPCRIASWRCPCVRDDDLPTLCG